MRQKISDYLQKLATCESAIRKQFEYDPAEENLAWNNWDPLLEEAHEVAPMLIHKYRNRALCLLTTQCAAYCRFCTRRRLVGDDIGQEANYGVIDEWVDYIEKNSQICEVIISGGDPFMASDEIFIYALQRLASAPNIKVIRIGTRAPVSNPALANQAKLDAISQVDKPIYVGIHFEHPAELTPDTIDCLRKLRKAGAILYSQSVFLKGVNDDVEILAELFTKLLENGVRPYYIYRCDPIPGAEHFIVDAETERRIMTELRKTLSGLACPTYVVDTPYGSGKIPVPLNFWRVDMSVYNDFNDTEHELI